MHLGKVPKNEGGRVSTTQKRMWFGPEIELPTDRELVIDSFAGGGGASMGIHQALGHGPDIAVDHSYDALTTHEVNHPATHHVLENVWRARLRDVIDGRPVGLLWASPDCRHFSRAKGSKPVSKRVRGLAWVVTRWAAEFAPRVICLENVREFEAWGPCVETEDGIKPCPKRKGQTFKRFVRQLVNLGYDVAWRTLNAADYGAPTHRRRLFLIARNDGASIIWPEPTHGGMLPYRTAAECINWSLPCPSIFGRAKPLAEKTMRRIALGITRYVLEAAEPFIVAATLAKHYGGVVGHGVERPLGTITSVDHHSLVAASLLQANHTGSTGRSTYTFDPQEPLRTVTSSPGFGVAAANLVKFRGDSTGRPVNEPMPTITGGAGAVRPAGAAHAMGVAATCQGNKSGLVYAFLMKYFGSGGQWARLDEPMHTSTSKHRFGLVTVEVAPGQHEQAIAVDVPGLGPHVIADIGLRMLQPRELARAQGFHDGYQLLGTTATQVALIGNSVPPAVVKAIVRANMGDRMRPA